VAEAEKRLAWHASLQLFGSWTASSCGAATTRRSCARWPSLAAGLPGHDPSARAVTSRRAVGSTNWSHMTAP
jgi:hypothetical protein